MTVTKDGVRITIRCDACPTVRVDQKGVRARWKPYNVAWAEAQAQGWTAHKKDKDWEHFCPECGQQLKQEG